MMPDKTPKSKVWVSVVGIFTMISMIVVSYFSVGAITGRYAEKVNQHSEGGTSSKISGEVDYALEYAISVVTTKKEENVINVNSIPCNSHTGTEEMPSGGGKALFKTWVPICDGARIYDGCVQAAIDKETGELVINNTEGGNQFAIEDGTKLGAFNETCGSGNYIYYMYGPKDACNGKEGTLVQMNATTGEKKEIKLSDEQILDFVTYDNGKIYVQSGDRAPYFWCVDEETMEVSEFQIAEQEYMYYKIGFIVKNGVLYIPRVEGIYEDGYKKEHRYSIYSYDIKTGNGKVEKAFGEMSAQLEAREFEVNRMALASTKEGFVFSNDTGIYSVDDSLQNPIQLVDSSYSFWRCDSGYLYYKLKEDKSYSLYRVRIDNTERKKIEPFTINGSYIVKPGVNCNNGVMCCYYYEEGDSLDGIANAQNSVFVILTEEEVSYVLADDFQDRSSFLPNRNYIRYDVKIPWVKIE